jgi:ABC-type cobalamin/Fe3+-siderophores transport system ATPase subunit
MFELPRLTWAELTIKVSADEPLAGLDPGCQLRLMEVLQKLARDDMAIALVLHDLDLATRYCDALYLLHEGRLLASGSPDEVLTGRNLGEAFGIKAWHGVIDSHRCLVPIKTSSKFLLLISIKIKTIITFPHYVHASVMPPSHE